MHSSGYFTHQNSEDILCWTSKQTTQKADMQTVAYQGCHQIIWVFYKRISIDYFQIYLFHFINIIMTM